MRVELTQEMLDLVREVVSRRAPSLMPLVQRLFDQPLPSISLSSEEQDLLSDVIISEFCDYGLGSDSEPNKYGILLDDIAARLLIR